MKSAFVWLVSLLLIWAVGMVQAQTVYQWTDENGVRHFSNTGPPSDAENVDTQTEKITPPQIEAEALDSGACSRLSS